MSLSSVPEYKDDDDGESSGGSERDDVFDEDMEALRRACRITGKNPGCVEDSDADSGEESSETNDLDLLRSIQERFSIPSLAPGSPPIVRPLKSILPTDSDEEDDFETLRVIQRRFEQYENDALNRKLNRCSHEAVFGVPSVTSGQETPNVLITNRNGEQLGQEYDVHSVPKPLGSISTANLENERYGSAGLHQVENGSCHLSARPLVHSQFPKSARLFVDALKKNRSCQKFIRNKLIEMEAKIEENKELTKRIKCLMDFRLACRKRAGRVLSQKKDPRIKLISLPKSGISSTLKANTKKISAFHFGPPENSHVSKYKMVLTRFPVSLRKQPWSKIEKENLAKGIKQQYQERVILSSMEFTSGPEGTVGDLDVMSASLKSNFVFTSESVRSFIPMVNWERLASMYLPGRTGAECEARWLNTEDPMINHNPWTNLEDKKLLFIAQNKGVFNWVDIAISMGTHRTPFQCLLRYQRSLNAYILKKDWTEDDDSQLRAAVETFGDDNWQLIASNMEGRTGPQCSNRWRKTLHPDRRRVGRWSVDEDKRLKVAVLLFGAKNWNKIARFAPGRTQVQCSERWRNCLDPSLNLKPWTEEEDSKLKAAVTENGYCWSKVAKFVPPRTDSQCRRRWKVLLPHEVPLLQAARKMQKTVLISNFVDREREKPSIGPNDFCPVPGVTSADEHVNNGRARKKRSRKGPKSNDQIDMDPRKCKARAKTLEENSFTDGLAELSEHITASKKREKKRSTKLLPDRGKCTQSAGNQEVVQHLEWTMSDTAASDGMPRTNDVPQSTSADITCQDMTSINQFAPESVAKGKTPQENLTMNSLEELSEHKTISKKRERIRSAKLLLERKRCFQSAGDHNNVQHPESYVRP